MKIKIELEVDTLQIDNVNKVTDLLMKISQELRKQEPELYQFIFALGYQCCEANTNGHHYDYDDHY